VVVPVLAWTNRGLFTAGASGPAPAPGNTGAGMEGLVLVYTLATLAWVVGKRHCIRASRRRLSRS
jgi:hypothetical protein